ncbi:MAG: hypothetical protein U0Q16_07225 [Bryobacteraceae bacterium]
MDRPRDLGEFGCSGALLRVAGEAVVEMSRELGPAAWISAPLLVVAVMRWRRTGFRMASWYAVAMLVAYALYVTAAPVRDPRYFLPVAIGLPFLMAVAAPQPSAARTRTRAWIALLAVAAAISWPMRSNLDAEPMVKGRAVLEKCRDLGLRRVTIASDGPRWSIDAIDGRRLDEDFEILAKADAVILGDTEPGGITGRVPAYRRFVASHGQPVEIGLEGIQLYRIQHWNRQ